MPQTFQGSLDASPGRWAIVVSRYNESITGRLLDGAIGDARRRTASRPTRSTWPGCRARSNCRWWPIGWPAAGSMWPCWCLGAVIRGETTHDQHINRAVSMALMDAGLRSGVPVLFGLLTCDTLEQAIHRAGGNMGNKGTECAEAALEMVSLMRQLPQ